MTDEPSNLPAPVTPAPLPAVTLPDKFDEVKQSRLAREIAMDIRDIDVVLKDFGLTAEQYKFLSTSPYYKKALEISLQEWNSALTTPQRIKVQAAALLEQNLVNLGARMGKDTEALPAVVETGKLLQKLSGIGEAGVPQSTGEKFAITINLGNDTQLKFEKDVTPTTIDQAIEVQGDKK